jgi:hypothetical protein
MLPAGPDQGRMRMLDRHVGDAALMARCADRAGKGAP